MTYKMPNFQIEINENGKPRRLDKLMRRLYDQRLIVGQVDINNNGEVVSARANNQATKVY